MWCLLHYRSWDGGRTWHFMYADHCREGKYKGTLAAGIMPSATVAPVDNAPQPATTAHKPSGTFVVLGKDRLENGERAAVYVRPGLSPEAVIAVDRNTARPIDLADALTSLMEFRASAASRETGTLHRLTVMPRGKAGVLPPAGRSRFAGYLAAFAKAPRIHVPGVGEGAAVEVWLPTTH
jgi:hypothetical protein